MAAVGVCDLEGEPQLPPASPGGSPGSVSGSDTGPFQTAASGLGHRVCEILCTAFKSGVFVSYSPPGLLHINSTVFKS